MNRTVQFLLLILFVGCQPATNVQPLEDYFIKFYGATGDQEGISVQSTPDGGFIIGGISVVEFGGTSDYLLIKVDASGNQEWQQTYDFEGTGGNDQLTEVLVEDNSYLIGGTSAINGVNKMVLLRVGLEGGVINSTVIFPHATNSFQTNSIVQLSTGGFLVSGPVIGGSATQKGKSLIAVINANLTITDSLLYPSSQVNPGEETVFVKALEVVNHFDPAGTETLNYLVFGYVNSIEGPKLSVFQFRESLGSPIINPLEKNYNNSIIEDVLQLTSSTYKILAASQTETYLINATESSTGYSLGASQILRSEGFIKGVSFALTASNNFIISSDITPPNSTNTLSSILEASNTGIINWERMVGADISYSSGKVILLENGSVVYTGTAGFKGQTKVFLIKLKSNGDMK